MSVRRSTVSLAIVLMATVSTAQAVTIWDEGVDGPLSTAGLFPTPVTLVSTSDLVVGDAVPDENFFTFDVPVGDTVDSLIIDLGGGPIAIVDIYDGLDSAGALLCNAGVSGAVDLLDGVTCPGLTSLSAGDYTFRNFNIVGTAWTVQIDGTVPVELMSFSIE